jgi:hypothetical protein
MSSLSSSAITSTLSGSCAAFSLYTGRSWTRTIPALIGQATDCRSEQPVRRQSSSCGAPDSKLREVLLTASAGALRAAGRSALPFPIATSTTVCHSNTRDCAYNPLILASGTERDGCDCLGMPYRNLVGKTWPGNRSGAWEPALNRSLQRGQESVVTRTSYTSGS